MPAGSSFLTVSRVQSERPNSRSVSGFSIPQPSSVKVRLASSPMLMLTRVADARRAFCRISSTAWAVPASKKRETRRMASGWTLATIWRALVSDMVLGSCSGGLR